MNDYLLGVYEKSMPNYLTIDEKLRCAKEAGFDYMELSIDESEEKLKRLDWNAEEIKRVADAVFASGVPIKSICLSGHRKFPIGHPDEKIRNKGMLIMEKAIVLASKLSVRIIQLAGYDVYYTRGTEQTKRLFVENLKKAALIASKYGVILAFETMETEFMNTVEKAVEFVKEVNSPFLQVYPDIGNITNAALRYNSSEIDDLERGRGHISAMHLKETVPGVFREVPFGTGHVDFISCIKQGLSMGVRMFVGEFWYVGAENWKEDLTRANEFLRGKISLAKAD